MIMKQNSKQSSGSAILVVVVLVAVISSLLAIMTASATQRAFTARKLANRVRALLYAEAGAHEAYSIIASDWTTRTNAALFPETSYGFGTYDVTVVSTDKVAVVYSKGVCNDTEVNVAVDIRNYGPPGSTTPFGPSPGSAWEYVIFSDGRLTINGGAGEVTGNLHANSDMRVNGGIKFTNNVDFSSSSGIKVQGTVGTLSPPHTLTAPDVNSSGGDISEESVALVVFPELDLTDYYNTALANGQIKSGGNYSSATWNSVPGNVIWINGDVKFTGSFESDAIVIATGNINVSGGASLNSANGSLISRDGSIKINGGTDSDSLIYAPGSITLGGNISVTGQIIAGDDVSLDGNIDVLDYNYANPSDGGEDYDPGDDLIGVSAWQS